MAEMKNSSNKTNKGTSSKQSKKSNLVFKPDGTILVTQLESLSPEQIVASAQAGAILSGKVNIAIPQEAITHETVSTNQEPLMITAVDDVNAKTEENDSTKEELQKLHDERVRLNKRAQQLENNLIAKLSDLERKAKCCQLEDLEQLLKRKINVAGYEEGNELTSQLIAFYTAIRKEFNLDNTLTKIKNELKENGTTLVGATSTQKTLHALDKKIGTKRLLSFIKTHTFEPKLL